MTARRAFRDGIRRVNSAPVLLLGMLLATLLLSLPPALMLRAQLQEDLGDSLAAETAASSVNYDWWQELADRTTGLGRTLSPSIIGFAAVLANLDHVLDDESLESPLVGVVTASLVLWAFLVGGILDRYARGHPTRAHGFFAACGTYFFRFIRLGAFAAGTYLLLFRFVHAWLFDELYAALTRDLTVERTAFLVRLGLYLFFGALLLGVNLVFDYAKIRAVVEDRRSMIGALVAGARFATRRAARVSGLYLLNGALFIGVIAAYALVAPGAGGTGFSLWAGLALGQAYILARLWAKLVFYASQTAFFQGELAHAEYAAAPLPIWPESPSAESLGIDRGQPAFRLGVAPTRPERGSATRRADPELQIG